MSKKRQQKTKQARTKLNQQQEKYRQLLSKFMRDSELAKEYQAVPGRFRELWCLLPDYPPKIIATESVPAALHNTVARWLAEELQPGFTIAHYHILITPIISCIGPDQDITHLQIPEAVTTIAKTLYDRYHDQVQHRLGALMLHICMSSTLDGPHYCLKAEYTGLAKVRQRFCLTIIRTDNPPYQLRLPEGNRLIYQVGLPLRIELMPTGVVTVHEMMYPIPAQVPSQSFGLPLKHSLPVYLQGHAVQRLQARLDISTIQQLLPLLVNYSLVGVQPLKQLDGSFYIPLHLRATHKQLPMLICLGYLVADLLPVRKQPAVVIRTFKFVTMEGTPEASRMSRSLRLRRLDINYYQLDRLSTLVNSDLIDQPELRSAFTKCGLGDLFRLVELLRTSNNTSKFNLAEDLMRHLSMRPAVERITSLEPPISVPGSDQTKHIL